MGTEVYRVRGPQAIAQEIDGEVIAIDLGTGNYYSLRGSAAAIWAGIERGAKVDSIAADLQGRFLVEDGAAIEAVRSFVADLVRERLIEPASANGDGDADGTGNAAELDAPTESVPGKRRQFDAPLLEKFDDMQELILLDPVHEVDGGAGWPHPLPAPVPED